MTTYLQMVNKLCRKVNEVELDATEFAAARGVQAVLKDGVIDTISMINQRKWKWPFNAVEATITLVPASVEYSWPDDYQSVDWNSFMLQKDPLLVTSSNQNLQVIEREEWYRYYRNDDTNALPEGKNLPRYVFSTHGNGFGITPAPKEAYTLRFRYFRNPPLPVNADDLIFIPKEYEYLVAAGGLYHAYLFLDNNERAALCQQERDQALKDMVLNLIGNNFEHVYDGRVNF